MRKATIKTTLANGGRVQNRTLINADNTAHQGKGSKVSDSQLEALDADDDVTLTVGYDRTRTYRQS